MKTLILCLGLEGAGKSTHVRSLVERIPNAICFDEKDIYEVLIQNQEDKTRDTTHVKIQSYAVMGAMAGLNLALGLDRTVIVEANFGDKLIPQLLQNFLGEHQDVTIKVIYFHCSGKEQLHRLRKRNEPHDDEKLAAENFIRYRIHEIEQHLLHLVQIPHLVVDTEVDLAANVKAIIDYFPQPAEVSAVKPVVEALTALTEQQAMQGAAGFSKLLVSLQCVTSLPREQVAASVATDPRMFRTTSPNSASGAGAAAHQDFECTPP